MHHIFFKVISCGNVHQYLQFSIELVSIHDKFSLQSLWSMMGNWKIYFALAGKLLLGEFDENACMLPSH
jgi:hypothetical protein